MKPRYYTGPVTDAELAAVPDEQRNPLVMLLRDGMSYEKIAAELGRPIGTVKSRIYRARQKIVTARRDFAAQEATVERAFIAEDDKRNAIDDANTQALAGLATFNKAFNAAFPKKD